MQVERQCQPPCFARPSGWSSVMSDWRLAAWVNSLQWPHLNGDTVGIANSVSLLRSHDTLANPVPPPCTGQTRPHDAAGQGRRPSQHAPQDPPWCVEGNEGRLALDGAVERLCIQVLARLDILETRVDCRNARGRSDQERGGESHLCAGAKEQRE